MSAPVEALVEGANRALFLAFREKCEFLCKTNIAGMFDNYECGHLENGFRTTFREQGKGHRTNTGGYPQCSLLACPIFERIKIGPPFWSDHYRQVFEEFRKRLVELEPIDA